MPPDAFHIRRLKYGLYKLELGIHSLIRVVLRAEFNVQISVHNFLFNLIYDFLRIISEKELQEMVVEYKKGSR